MASTKLPQHVHLKKLFSSAKREKSAMMRLNNYDKSVTEERSANQRTEKKDYCVNEPLDNSYMYTYPPGFTPSAATKAFLEEQVPTPKKNYVLPPDIFETGKKTLPDISDDLQKEMERLAAQNLFSHEKPEKEASEFDKTTVRVYKGTSSPIIDRYDEYLRIKKTMQGLIRPAVSPITKAQNNEITDKQKIKETSHQTSKPSDFVRGISTKLFTSETESEFHSVIDLTDVRDLSLPRPVQDKRKHAQEVHIGKFSEEIVSKNRKRQRQAEGSQQNTSRYIQTKSSETVGTKGNDESMEHPNEKRDRDTASDGNDADDKGTSAKRVKAFPVQLSFLEQASIPKFKIPRRGEDCAKYLEVPKVGLKKKGHGDVETYRCGKRSRNH